MTHVIDAPCRWGAKNVHLVYGHGGELLKKNLAGSDLNWVLQQSNWVPSCYAAAAPFFADDEDVLMLYATFR